MRYRVDLKRFMAECEANYQRLVKLFPDMENLDHYRFGISGGRHISLRVIKRAPYTSLLEISEEAAGDRDVDKTAWLSAPTMEVRLYHDARLAEVVSCEAVHRINPRYRYPNRKMHQPTKKPSGTGSSANGLPAASSAAMPCYPPSRLWTRSPEVGDQGLWRRCDDAGH